MVPHLTPTSIACCSDSHFCNQNLSPMYRASQPLDGDGDGDGGGGADWLRSLDESTAIALLVSLFVCLSKETIGLSDGIQYCRRQNHPYGIMSTDRLQHLEKVASMYEEI